MHSVEKVGGTSMNDYCAVRDNIVLGRSNRNGDGLYRRILVVSAYAGITNLLLEHKKSGNPGIYSLFADSNNDDSWKDAFAALRLRLHDINAGLFSDPRPQERADEFIDTRLDEAYQCLEDLERLCQHGHFSLTEHLATVREMLASIGEAHSAWNTAERLKMDGINAVFTDLTGWSDDRAVDLDERIRRAFAGIDLESQLPIVTGYAFAEGGLMATFDRGYSEMTFSRIAVLTEATEAVIHKEFHLSSADPRLVGVENAVPIGRTNYDVADYLANLGMEAIHPEAAKGLRKSGIPLRVKNTFEPDHDGTVITGDYKSDEAVVEIIACRKGVYAVEIFDQEMSGIVNSYETEILSVLKDFRCYNVAKELNANTITHYIAASLKIVRRIRAALEQRFPTAEVDQKRVALVSALGTAMKEPGMLARAVTALEERDINILAVHQSMRQVDMQFVVPEQRCDEAVRALHACLVEVYNHTLAISS